MLFSTSLGLAYRSRNGGTWSCRKSARCSLSPPWTASTSRDHARWPTRTSLSTRQAEKTSNQLHHSTVGRTRKGVWKNKISWCLHERRTSYENQFDWSKSSGENCLRSHTAESIINGGAPPLHPRACLPLQGPLGCGGICICWPMSASLSLWGRC